MDEQTMVDSHGVEVFSRSWPIDEPTGLVIIAHGASEHSGRYDRFAKALNAAGFAAVAIDHRGHGRTGAATVPGLMGPGGGQAVIDDLHQLRAAEVAKLADDTPVFFFGHSMGSLIGLAYLTQHSDGLAGGILCGMAADVNEAAGTGALLQGFADAGMRDMSAGDLLAANNAAFDPPRTPFDWLSRDEAEVDRYVADPYCGDNNPLTFGYLIDLFDVVGPATEHIRDIACPVLVIAGDQDPAAAMGAHAIALAKALTANDVPCDGQIYEGARHELLNETNRDEVTADIIAWLQSNR
ncbi:MAG TPA: alpha/beta hydrolase [Ilumatobacteraceae bacterium]|nr:alpha/beta hydrolase [Ilumatobacteraceae bacterium]HRB04387.1 alpha/beta hydrolase [Ilumatobacteraceae bacterium]